MTGMLEDHAGPRRTRNGRGRRHPGAQQGGKRCSFPWINSQIIQASEAGDVHQLLGTVMEHLPQMNLVNLSTAVHRLAKLTANDSKGQGVLRQHRALEELLEAISAAFACLSPAEAQPQSLSNVVWSLATMRLMNTALIEKVAALAVTNISIFKPFELSTMLWALAKLGTLENVAASTKPVFQASAAHIMKHVQQFGFRCLATTAWAFATAKQHHARLFRSLAAQMLPMVHVANCQEMANTAWAFGTANFHDDQLFLELADKALLRLEEFKPQELSNMLWGFASNGFFHEGFFASTSLVAQRMDLQAQHLANILWAYARVQPRHIVTKTTVLALLPWCTLQLNTFKPQEVSATVLAVAKSFGRNNDLEVRAPSLAAAERRGQSAIPHEVLHFFGAVIPWALPRMREFSAQSLANTVSAYAMVHVPGAESLFTAIGDEVLKRYESLDSTMLLHLLKGFAAAPQECSALSSAVLQALATGVAHHVTELRPQELQALSRLCAGLQGWRRSRDLTCDELRHCLLEYAEPHSPNGHYSTGHLVMDDPLAGQDLQELLWQEDDFCCIRARPASPQVSTKRPPAKIRNARAPVTCGALAKQKAAWQGGEEPGGHSPLCTISEMGRPTLGEDPYTPLCRVNEYGDTVMSSEPQPQKPASSGQVAMQPDETSDFCASLDPVQPTAVPFLGFAAMLALAEAAEAQGLEEHFDPQGGPGGLRPRLRGGAPAHTDFQWRCSIKNSFLHIEASEESESGSDTCDGGSSQRSNSVPSRMGSGEVNEDRRGRRRPS